MKTTPAAPEPLSWHQMNAARQVLKDCNIIAAPTT